ncbi:MAG: hypothetical protein IPJ41_09775 [Phycisphaerales bacterium]|nr:hypothetical protein [Phycisphaerales bacterium]
MNLSQFFDHWSIAENPFKGEEARDDAVFVRLGMAKEGETGGPVAAHSDFEKVLGSLLRPSTAVVFGEKGSGKTALRMQIADHIRRYNLANPDQGVWIIAYDDLNAVLDEIHERSGGTDAAASLKSIRLVDHIDAMLSIATTSIVDQLIGGPTPHSPCPVTPDAAKRLRRASPQLKRDLALLQACYDGADQAVPRGRELRKRLRIMPGLGRVALAGLAWGGWVLPAAAAWYAFFQVPQAAGTSRLVAQVAAGVLGVAWLALAGRAFLLERWRLARLGRRLRKQLRSVRRSDRSLAEALRPLPREDQSPLVQPMTDTDETRYAMLDRLKRVLALLGYRGVMVLVDRIDEPTLVSGDPERMRAVVWPMFNNKFLQQEAFGLKMLLPIELRYALFKESSAFFQEARLDKQNLIERLSWTGSMLYDLCDARLKACRKPDADGKPLTLLDLFAEDVTGRDVVDALDQMHQPRDAFKLLYRCLSEHCSNVTAEQNQWRVPRLVLEHVRKQEAERVQQLYRGIRPA